MSMPLKIAIVVHGRFHAFDQARELVVLGHDVTLLTNYPKRVAARFGIEGHRVRSFVTHGVLVRACEWLHRRLGLPFPEAWLHRMFGRWAATTLEGEAWDVIHCWSGVSEELLDSPRISARCSLLMRGSAHIEVQSRLLEEEERRAGVQLDRPSAWMRSRELREYEKAGHILVLSTFARESFQRAGVSPDKLSTMLLGVRVDAFRSAGENVRARQARIRSGAPLRVLYVGAVSFRKGLLDLATMIDELHSGPFHFTIVGPVLPEAEQLVGRLRGKCGIVGKLPQSELPERYQAADLFLFPTIEDGFPAVMAQAKAAALPILTTPHGAGVDIVASGTDGWILPVRDPAAFVRQLRWCHEHRDAVAEMMGRVHEAFRPRDWADVAADFETICESLVDRGIQQVRRHG
jgi:glycosyltransferase involved in cell wall biosynthesis